MLADLCEKIQAAKGFHVINFHCVAEWQTNRKHYMGTVSANIEATTLS